MARTADDIFTFRGWYLSGREREILFSCSFAVAEICEETDLFIYLFIVHVSNLMNHTLKKEFKGSVLA